MFILFFFNTAEQHTLIKILYMYQVAEFGFDKVYLRNIALNQNKLNHFKIILNLNYNM